MSYIDRFKEMTDDDLYVFNEETADIINGACRELNIEEEHRYCIECLRQKYFIVYDIVMPATIITVKGKKYEYIGGRRVFEGRIIGRTSPKSILNKYYKSHKYKFKEIENERNESIYATEKPCDGIIA